MPRVPQTLNRRRFLGGALATAGLGLSGCSSAPPYQSLPGERLRVGMIGVGRHGRRHLLECLRRSDAEVVAVCDPDLVHLSHAASLAQSRGHRALPYRDVRQLLADPAVQAVVVATPDHWHCLATLWALEAGKHVYCEAPATHGILEGEMLVAGAADARLHVQAAMPLRCSGAVHRGVEFLHAGSLGEIRWVRAICFVQREGTGPRILGGEQTVPSVDLDLWTGPAQRRPLRRFRLHGDWRYDWATGSGDIGEWGVHLLDLARWILREELPARVWACGGRFGPRDSGETPNTLVAALDFDAAPVSLEIRNLPAMSMREPRMDRVSGISLGVLVGCLRGQVLFDVERGRTAVIGRDGTLQRRFDGGGNALGQFIARTAGDVGPFVDVQEVRTSTDLAHLISVAYRTAAAAPEAACLAALRDVAEQPMLVECCDSMVDHLARRGVGLDDVAPRLSGWLSVDPDGSFVHSDAANELRARTYRPPFTPATGARRV